MAAKRDQNACRASLLCFAMDLHVTSRPKDLTLPSHVQTLRHSCGIAWRALLEVLLCGMLDGQLGTPQVSSAARRLQEPWQQATSALPFAQWLVCAKVPSTPTDISHEEKTTMVQNKACCLLIM